jgi:hypothetical protein
MHRKVAAAFAAALALGVGGCGGSEAQLTRAQLVRRIEVACRQGQRETQTQMRSSRGSNDGTAFLDAILAGQNAVMDKIGDLNAPAAAQADYDAVKKGMEQRIELVKRVQSAGRAGLQRAMAAVQPQADAATRRVQAATRRLGVEGCI